MKLMDGIASEKLLGAFYTPDFVVDVCLNRIATLLSGKTSISLLEPSVGDGAFLKGVHKAQCKLLFKNVHTTGIELVPGEAKKCKELLQDWGMSGEIITSSFFEWASQQDQFFDAVIGNPPFIRYQFMTETDRLLAEFLLQAEGHTLQGVSNVWIPFVLLSLKLLKIGGGRARRPTA